MLGRLFGEFRIRHHLRASRSAVYADGVMQRRITAVLVMVKLIMVVVRNDARLLKVIRLLVEHVVLLVLPLMLKLLLLRNRW